MKKEKKGRVKRKIGKRLKIVEMQEKTRSGKGNRDKGDYKET